MSTYSTTLTARLLLPGSEGVLVQATYDYDSADPVSITVKFHTNVDEPVVWVFGRDLLLLGVTERAGEGDVVVWPKDRGLHMSLSSPFGQAEFMFDKSDVVAFLDKTFALVPLGSEFAHLDVDALLADFLGDSDAL